MFATAYCNLLGLDIQTGWHRELPIWDAHSVPAGLATMPLSILPNTDPFQLEYCSFAGGQL